MKINMEDNHCSKHPKTIDKYAGSLEDLANDLGDLHYQELTRFLELLANKIVLDSEADLNRGRKQLATHLRHTAESLYIANENMGKAWNVSAPYMTEAKHEDIPEILTVDFVSYVDSVTIYVNGKQAGSVLNDNSLTPDYYRYHDVFHFAYATCLGWSPVTRNLLGLEPKQGDGSAMIEEALSLIIFNDRKKANKFSTPSDKIVYLVSGIARDHGINSSRVSWNYAIHLGYSMFNKLVENGGGRVVFDTVRGSAMFSPITIETTIVSG